jgi:hypothetical protein
MNAYVRILGRSVQVDGVGAFSTWLCQQLLGHVFLPQQVYTPPRALYAALYTMPPSAGGGGTEVAGDGAYARVAVPFRMTPSGVVTNAAQLLWRAPVRDWGAITALGLFDQAVAGNFLSYGWLLGPDGMPTSVPVPAGGQPFVVDAGALTVGLV